MPGLVKIGRTSTSVEQRMRELDTTGVPLPYQCFYAAKVINVDFVEKQIHYAFGEQRLRKNREFFKIDPSRVKAVIELIALEEVTPQIYIPLNKEDSQAITDYNERRGPFRFSLAKVPIGAELKFIRDENKSCRVVDDRSVDYNGQVTSLSAAASQLLQEMGWKSPQVAGPLYWSFDGEALDERRQRLEASN